MSTLAECVFRGNALLTVGGSTPYNAVYGRVPSILPGIDQVTPPEGQDWVDAFRQNPGTLPHAPTSRSECSGHDRRFSRNQTRSSTKHSEHNASSEVFVQVGEEVDFHRSQSSKDASGWLGPAEVVDVARTTRGVVALRWQNRPMEIQVQDLRRHLHFL